MNFKNSKGETVKTILPKNIMDQITNLIEKELKDKNIFYTKNGTVFQVKGKDMDSLFKAQENANLKLMSEGVITIDMLMDDLISNFG